MQTDEGYKLKYLQSSGMTIVNDSNTIDRFRGRIIFPVKSISGRTIAFVEEF